MFDILVTDQKWHLWKNKLLFHWLICLSVSWTAVNAECPPPSLGTIKLPDFISNSHKQISPPPFWTDIKSSRFSSVLQSKHSVSSSPAAFCRRSHPRTLSAAELILRWTETSVFKSIYWEVGQRSAVFHVFAWLFSHHMWGPHRNHNHLWGKWSQRRGTEIAPRTDPNMKEQLWPLLVTPWIAHTVNIDFSHWLCQESEVI